MLGAVNPWAFHTHPDTWFVVVAAGFAYWYAIRRIGPRVLGDRSGGRSEGRSEGWSRGWSEGRSGGWQGGRLGGRLTVATRRQILCFYAGLLVIEVSGDWPLHDLAENYLYSAHMLQHLLVSLIAPPLLLLGMPAWLVRRMLRRPWAGGTVRVMARPLVAGLTFNAVIAISHAPFWVNGTLEHHYLHFWAHLLLFLSAMLMWFPVINRLEEFPSLSGTGRMIYLFVMSIVPNVPAAFLLLATGVVYKFYATVPHPFAGLNAVNDQQLAGAIMKVGGTTYLWALITVMFFRWVASQVRSGSAAEDRDASAAAAVKELVQRRQPAVASVGSVGSGSGARSGSMPKVLTWDDVAEELARTPPASPGDFGGRGGPGLPGG
jgi:putative membrane protein